eukprot:SAG11_NODE_28689_length_319_cov_0.500000_1_plen_101_part_01
MALPRWLAGELLIAVEAKQAAVVEDTIGARLLALGGPVWLERRRSWWPTNGEKVVLIIGEGGQRQLVRLWLAWEEAAAQRIAEKQCVASQLALVNFHTINS